MFEISDQKFLRALESEEEFEKHLGKLKKTRTQSAIFAGAAFVLFFVFFYMSIDIARKCPDGISQTMVLLGSFAFLLSPLMITIKAYNIHSQIRTLLVFKKLRDDKSVVTP